MNEISIDIFIDDDKKFLEFLKDEFQCQPSLRDVFGTIFERKTENEIKCEKMQRRRVSDVLSAIRF